MSRMSRIERLLKYADTAKPGIEVAPYFNPTLRKADGFPILTVDVLDAKTLRKSCIDDPLIPTERAEEIEEVDIVGDASSIGTLAEAKGLTGNIHYILSSHNFEHLPNPIRFLRGCTDVLAPGGVLSMAVPDYRSCFDIHRYPTRLSDWLEAYHDDRAQPNAATVFDSLSNKSLYHWLGKIRTGCTLGSDDASGFVPNRVLRESYADFLERRAGSSSYRDSHVSVFFPQTLELMLRDLRYLGLINLDIIEVMPTTGLEFFVHLRKAEAPVIEADAAFYDRRDTLLVDISRNLGRAPYMAPRWPWAGLGRRIERSGQRLLARLLGEERFWRLDDWFKETVRKRRAK